MTAVVVDSSALIAIILAEPEASSLVRAITAASVRVVAAPTLVEASSVLFARIGLSGYMAIDALLHRLSITTVAMTPDAAEFAREGFRRFGKGVGKPSVLNYGDCLVYGVAKSLGYPLLFKGNDFTQTDARVAIY